MTPKSSCSWPTGWAGCRWCRVARPSWKRPTHRTWTNWRAAASQGAVSRSSQESRPAADPDRKVTGVPPLPAKSVNAASERTAQVAAEFIAQSRKLLAGEKHANGLTLRGFSAKPALPSYEQVYGLKAAAIAVYPMYKGLA